MGLLPDPKPETEPTVDVTSTCIFYYKASSWSDYQEVTGSRVTVRGVTGTNSTISYYFKGGNIKLYGKIKDSTNSYSYRFGYRYLYGVTSGTLTNINSLSMSGITMKSSYYSVTYTTTLSTLATFALPADWGNITKVTDNSGVTEYDSFAKIGTFSRIVDGISISYNVWRWAAEPPVLNNFTFRFYN